MPLYDDGTGMPVESQIAPEAMEEFRKWQKEQKAKEQAPKPSSGGSSGSSKPKPQQPKPQQQGPQDPAQLNPIQKFFEEKVAIPVRDFVDNTFEGNQRTPDQIAKDRATARAGYQSSMEQGQRFLDSQPGSMAVGEVVRGIAGGAEDLVEGVVNLPGQVTTLFGNDYKPINTGLIRENSTTAGDGLRTISRYVMGGLGVGAITRGGFGAGMAGAGLFGARFAQGALEDFVSADGTSEDNTLIGQTPFTQWLQTSDKNNPLHNRALVAIEGGLFEAAGLPAVKALWKVSGAGQAARKLGEVADNAFKGAKAKQLEKSLAALNKKYKLDLAPPSTADEIQDLIARTKSMLTDPQVLKDQKAAREAAEVLRITQEATAPQRAIAARERLNKLMASTFAGDQFGATLDFSKQIDMPPGVLDADIQKINQYDAAMRLLQDDPQRTKLEALITEAADVFDGEDVKQYLRAHVEGLVAARQLDEIAETVTYGGKPDEMVVDTFKLPQAIDALTEFDRQIAEIEANLAPYTEQISANAAQIKDFSQQGGRKSLDIAQLMNEEQLAPSAEIKLNLSVAQTKALAEIGLPEGVEITGGRRVKGLTPEKLNQLVGALEGSADGTNKVTQNLIQRLRSVEQPPEDFRSREAIQAQLEQLRAERADLFQQSVTTRTAQVDAVKQQRALQAQLEQLKVQREAIAANLSGTQDEFKAAYQPVDTSPKNVTSIVKESAGGQSGIDLYFEDKRFPALLDGRVKEIGRQGNQSGGYGNYVVIESIDPKTGQSVDVLYAHMADNSIKVKEGDLVGTGQQIGTQGGTGSVRSVDGTIASIDFLAPAPKGSKSMVPYAYWNELADDITLNIQRGGLQPSQVGRKAPTVAPEVIEGAMQQADELAPVGRRIDAIQEGGFEVDQLAPTRPRTDVVDDFIEEAEPVIGTAKPGRASLTEMDVHSLSVGAEGKQIIDQVASTLERRAGLQESKVIEAIEPARELAKEALAAPGDQFMEMVLNDTRFITELPNGEKLFTPEQLAANGMIIRELQRQMIDLGTAVLKHAEDGAPQMVQDGVRLVDRMMAVVGVRKRAQGMASDALKMYDYVGRNLPEGVDSSVRMGSKKIQEFEKAARQSIAQTDNMYNKMMELRTKLLEGDPRAWTEFKRAATALQVMVPTQKNFNALVTALSSVGKGLDGLYINSILSGPVTQGRNFWGNFYQATGHPLLALLGTALPGKSNALVRHQAVAAFGATIDTMQEFTSLIPRLYKKQGQLMDATATEYHIWDEALERDMMQLQAEIEAGNINFVAKSIASLGINMRKVLRWPVMQPVMRFMGSVDNFFKVVAGRQTAARRAVEDALGKMGDAPLTGKRAEKFAELVTEYKELHMKQIFDADGLEVIDEEALELGKVFTFQTPINKANVITRKLDEISNIPGMKFLGLSFVKTPSAILASSANLTPGLSTILKHLDQNYKNGDAYYRAMRDGTEAMSYLLGGTAYFAGMNGVITGAGPLDPDKKREWLISHKPFTITIGGAELNYQAMEPASTIIGFFADAGALMTSDDPERGSLLSLGAILSSNIVNKSYLAQVSTIAELISASSEKDFGRLAENMARGIVPYSGARSQLGQMIDPAIRELRSELEPTWDWFLTKHGGLGSTMGAPQQLDPVTGEPLTRDGFDGIAGSLSAILQPLIGSIRFSKSRFKPVHRYLEAEGYDITNRTKELMGQKLTNEQMVEYNRIRAGNGALEKDLNDYFNSDQYKQIDKIESDKMRSDGYKVSETPAHQQIEAIVQWHHDRAVAEMEQGLTSMSGELMQRVDKTRQAANAAERRHADRQSSVMSQLEALKQFTY